MRLVCEEIIYIYTETKYNLIMKNVQFIRQMSLMLFVGLISQTSIAQLIEKPKESITLQIKDSLGTNGSMVAYNPEKQLYYAVIAGNSMYPLEVFNSAGKNLYSTEAGNDMRGLWWNPKKKQLEGNGYGETGITGLLIDDQGYPSVGSTTIYSGSEHQPDANSCGVYDGKKTIYYFDGEYVRMYSRSSGELTKTLDIDYSSISKDNLNATSMIYTGVKGMEIGLLDYSNNKVYLMNKKTGSLAATVSLPSSAVTNYSFRFAYANKHVFLYDIDARSWTGYKIFQ